MTIIVIVIVIVIEYIFSSFQTNAKAIATVFYI